jgi:hypothetical protein
MELENQTPNVPSDVPAKEPRPSNEQKGLDVRVEQSLAIGRYLRASAAFDAASDEYSKACASLKEALEDNAKFVCKVDWRHYLVEKNIHGGFEINEIEIL